MTAPKKKPTHPWRAYSQPETSAQRRERQDKVLPYQHNPIRRYTPK